MNWETVLATIWTAVNSPIGITTMAAVLFYGLNKLYSKKPLWEQYEGAVIAGIKFAEKEIPDDVGNKGLQRLDAALRYVVSVYEEAKGRKASAAEVQDLKNGIQVTHATLEAKGSI